MNVHLDEIGDRQQICIDRAMVEVVQREAETQLTQVLDACDQFRGGFHRFDQFQHYPFGGQQFEEIAFQHGGSNVDESQLVAQQPVGVHVAESVDQDIGARRQVIR